MPFTRGWHHRQTGWNVSGSCDQQPFVLSLSKGEPNGRRSRRCPREPETLHPET